MSDPKIKGYEDKMNKAIEFLEADLQTVRAGRANPHILDHVRVDYYGAPTPLQQVANVSVPAAPFRWLTSESTRPVMQRWSALFSLR